MNNNVISNSWPYLDLVDGKLFEDGFCAFPANTPLFADVDDANAWLADQDVRGTVR